MLTRRHVILFRQESNYGSDAVQLLAPAARATAAISVSEAAFSTSREQIDRQVLSSSLSPRVTPVGFGSAEVTFTQDLRGSGAPGTAPDWAGLALACAMQIDRAATMRLTGMTADDPANPGTRIPGGDLALGQLLLGPLALAGTGWVDAIGSTTAATLPAVGDPVIFWPATGTETQPTARGTVIAATATGAQIKLDEGSFALLTGGMHVRAGAAAYGDIDTDVAMGVVTRWVADPGAAGEGDVSVTMIQGAFADTDKVQGVTCDVDGDVSGAPGVGGFVLHPDSQFQIEFEVGAWSAGAPAVGDELVAKMPGGQKQAAGKIAAIDPSGTPVSVEPYYGLFLNGGVVSTTAGSTATISSDPVQTRTPSGSIWSLLDGFFRKAVGCRGTFSINLEAGNPGTIDFTFSGSPLEPEVGAMPTGITFPSVVAPGWAGGICEIDGARVRVLSATIDIGNDVQRETDANSPEGTVGNVITARDVTISMEVERAGIAGLDLEGHQKSGQTFVVGIQVGSQPDNIVSILVPAAQLTEISDGDQNGLATASLTLHARAQVDDSEIFIASA